jgi:hypothetical protein
MGQRPIHVLGHSAILPPKRRPMRCRNKRHSAEPFATLAWSAYFSLSHKARCVPHREIERFASRINPESALVMAARSGVP